VFGIPPAIEEIVCTDEVLSQGAPEVFYVLDR